MANKIEFYPMTEIERDMVEFLQHAGLSEEAKFLDSLYDQEDKISYKQRVRLWKIPSKYTFPESTIWPHKEVVTTISFLIEAIEAAHKGYWADRVAEEHKQVILRHLQAIAQRRSDWLEAEMQRLENA